MKKAFATLTATGLLTLGALAGTAATASAQTVLPPGVYGPFPSVQQCEQYMQFVVHARTFECYGSGTVWWGHFEA